MNCVANHPGEVVAGTLGLGDPLGWIQADDDSGLAHVTINAQANGDVGDVGAAIASAVACRCRGCLRVVHFGAVRVVRHVEKEQNLDLFV